MVWTAKSQESSSRRPQSTFSVAYLWLRSVIPTSGSVKSMCSVSPDLTGL